MKKQKQKPKTQHKEKNKNQNTKGETKATIKKYLPICNGVVVFSPYTNWWGSRSPDGWSEKECVAVVPGLEYTWSDKKCADRLGFFCETSEF